MQCVNPDIGESIWPVPEGTVYNIDDRLRMKGPLPRGPPSSPENLARPNILMFGDWLWVGERTKRQEDRFDAFCDEKLYSQDLPFVVIEIGAGLFLTTQILSYFV